MHLAGKIKICYAEQKSICMSKCMEIFGLLCKKKNLTKLTIGESIII